VGEHKEILFEFACLVRGMDVQCT